jgi:hypothetical protein
MAPKSDKSEMAGLTLRRTFFLDDILLIYTKCR